MLTRASNRYGVEHFKEIKTKAVEQCLSGTLLGRKFAPVVESSLCLAENIVNGVLGFEKSVDVRHIAFVGESKLILQVIKAVVDGGSRQHQYFGFDTGSNHFVHQLEITVLTWILVVLVGSDFASVAEVMAFINNHEVVVAPVDAFKVCSVGIAV